MARKVFISFLGTTDYFPSQYYRGKFCSEMEKYVQIAALQYLQRNTEWTKDDIAYILLTEMAEQRNWQDNGYVDRNGISNVGLESQVNQMSFPFKCTPITKIPEGKNEQEIWEIFQRIHDLIQEGDELFFDITHGYRYLPMLVVVLGNYSKFLEKAKVMHILYGNYEGRDKDEKGEYINPSHSPIVDLQSFSTLQDLTYSAADLIYNGNGERLAELAKTNALVPLLRERGKSNIERIGTEQPLKEYVKHLQQMLADMRLCMLPNLQNGETARILADLKIALNQRMESIIAPLRVVFDKIHTSFADIGPKAEGEILNIENGYAAAKWCFEHQLYQQALTILHENITTDFCLLIKGLHIEGVKLNHKKYEHRKMVADCLRSDKDDKNEKEETLALKKKIRTSIANDPDAQYFIYKNRDIFLWTTWKRNIYDHASAQGESLDPKDEEESKDKKKLSFIETLGDYINKMTKKHKNL